MRPTPATPPGASLTDILAGLLQDVRLTPAQRRIAHHLLEHPHESVLFGSGELATRVGVSQPSVSRFAQTLGFRGYGDLANHLRAQVGRPDGEASSAENHFERAVAAEVENLQTLGAELRDRKRLVRLAAGLAKSRPLCVLGFRASAPVALYCGFFAGEIHPDVRVLLDEGSTALNELLRAHQAGASWLLVFALPRVPRGTVEAIDYARSLGYRIAVVGPSRVLELSQGAEAFFPVQVGTGLLFDSYASPIVFAAALVDAMADTAPEYAQRRLEAFEELAVRTGIFAPSENGAREGRRRRRPVSERDVRKEHRN